ncbi:hypothetical protein V1293_006710 [Bradyrhizobium sp. AZCC 1693]
MVRSVIEGGLTKAAAALQLNVSAKAQRKVPANLVLTCCAC